MAMAMAQGRLPGLATDRALEGLPGRGNLAGGKASGTRLSSLDLRVLELAVLGSLVLGDQPGQGLGPSKLMHRLGDGRHHPRQNPSASMVLIGRARWLGRPATKVAR